MPTQLAVPKPSESRDAILRIVRSSLIRKGVPVPNVTSTSDYYITADALSQQLSILFANAQIAADDQMIDTAEEEELLRIAGIYDVEARPEQSSHGNIVIRTSAATFVAVGRQLVDGSGQSYEVETGGTYSDEDEIPVSSISTGTATSLPQGTPLQWVGSPPSFSDATALVAIGGLIDGADADTVETVRARALEAFRNPAQAGNSAQIAKWCTDASASVQAAYVYPALNGPSTIGVCIVGPLTYDVTNGWSRGVSDAVLGVVISVLSSKVPEGVVPGLVVKTPKDTGSATPSVDVDVSIGLALPSSANGGGPGGGWVDPVAWPDLVGTATRCSVSVVTDSTHITLTSDDPSSCPSSDNLVAGETTVCWFSSARFANSEDPVVVATVTSVAGTTGALQIGLSEAFTGIAVGDFVFPNSENVQAYAQAFMASMNDIGSGQWTAHPLVITYAKRRPLVTASNPCDLGPTLIRAITDAGAEVDDAAFLYRSSTSPGVPVSTFSDSPNCLVPRRLGFYDKIL